MQASATNFFIAISKPLNLWQTLHDVAHNGNITKLSKVTELASVIFKAAEILTPLQSATTATFHNFCKTIKFTGKLVRAEGLLINFFNPNKFMREFKNKSNFIKVLKVSSPIFFPKKDAQCYLARTDGLPFESHSWLTKPLYVIKIGSLSTGSALQSYIIGKKILFPQLFSQFGAQFVETVGITATKIGGQNLGTVAKVVTNAGASTIKNYCFLIYLTFESYQCYSRLSSSTDPKPVVDQLKFVANCGKLVILASLTIFNAPALVVVGVSLVVCWVEVSEVIQSMAISEAKNNKTLKST